MSKFETRCFFPPLSAHVTMLEPFLLFSTLSQAPLPMKSKQAKQSRKPEVLSPLAEFRALSFPERSLS